MTARERTREALGRAALLGGKDRLNCIAQIDPTAQAQADALDAVSPNQGPFWGTPILVKDNIDVQGLLTTAGSLALEDNMADRDAPIVRNLRKNGAVILGKTNMTEFANYTTEGMPNGYSSRGGQVIHAVHPDLDPSGSSSGSGVAVAAGIVPAAVGTDTSFSIIACAQANGICGIKPPIGALSSEGIIPIAHSFDSAGPMARNLTDALHLYNAMRDTPLPLPAAASPASLRLGVNTAGTDAISDGQQAFHRDMLDVLRRCGAIIDEIYQPYTPLQSTMMLWEFRTHLEDYLRTSNASRRTLAEIVACYEADPGCMMRYGASILQRALRETPSGTAGQPYRDAAAERQETIRQVASAIAGFDAVIMAGATNIMHFCGLPSVTVAGSHTNDKGVRRCIIVYGADEARLYSAALAIEKCINERILPA